MFDIVPVLASRGYGIALWVKNTFLESCWCNCNNCWFVLAWYWDWIFRMGPMERIIHEHTEMSIGIVEIAFVVDANHLIVVSKNQEEEEAEYLLLMKNWLRLLLCLKWLVDYERNGQHTSRVCWRDWISSWRWFCSCCRISIGWSSF